MDKKMLTDEYLLDLKHIATKSNPLREEEVAESWAAMSQEQRDAVNFNGMLLEHAHTAIPLMVDELIELRKNAQRDLQTFTAYYTPRPPTVVNNYHCTSGDGGCESRIVRDFEYIWGISNIEDNVEDNADDDYILVALEKFDPRKCMCAEIKNKAGRPVRVGKFRVQDDLLLIEITIADIKKANGNPLQA